MNNDLISRKALKEAVLENGITDILNLIDNAPTVYPICEDKACKYRTEKPQGEWVSHIQYCNQHNLIPTGYGLFVWCNRCDCPNEKKTKFCPNCGAIMKRRIKNDSRNT